MIKNYFTAAIRILVKEKLYTTINVIGLSIGLTGSLLIYMWIKSETSYDQFPGSNQVYRVTTFQDDTPNQGIASTYPMMKGRVLSQFPEIEQCVRVFNQGFLGSKTRVTYGDKIFIDNRFYYADSTFLKVFPWRVLKGDPNTCLSKSNSIIITESTAKKIFGDEEPVGKLLKIGVDFYYEVTAVLEDVPLHHHFHFDLLASMRSHPWIKNAEDNVWSGVVFHTYIKLRKESSASDLQSKIAMFMDNFPNDPDHIGKSYDFRLQPVEDIHLLSNLKFELEENGDIYYVYLFSIIASLVLVVAIINYINLTTARHTQRLKEVGVRKILGAQRMQLISQFMTESFLVTFVAFALAIILAELSRPILTTFSGPGYFQDSFWTAPVFLTSIGLSLLIGIVTGLMPAIILSSFKPIRLFKVNLGSFAQGATLRKALVISQFTVSITLTACTILIYNQVTYIKQTNLGYQKENTVVVNIGWSEVRKQYQTFKSLLVGHSSIVGATATSQLPTDIQTGENIDLSPSKKQGVYCASVDPDFFKVMNIRIKNGDQLIQSISPSDSLNYFAFNEATLNAVGWTEGEAINQKISIRHGNQKPGPVLAVFEDFHFQSFHHAIEPLVLEFNPTDFEYLLIKIKPERISETIQFIGEQWKQVAGAIPFHYSFLDQEYDKLYRSENKSSGLFMVFAGIALFISSLGLFGLSSFAAEKRTKEIGIRKILGANIRSIVGLTSKDFLTLLVLSFILAVPVSYYFMNSWLSNFAYRISIDSSPFLLAGIVNVCIALSILSFHIIRITRVNPVETLRSE